ncbi:MAG: zinc-ribbon domain-containing protein [Sphingorhabdus sp.]
MVKFCTSCGNGLTPDARFCPKCGAGQRSTGANPLSPAEKALSIAPQPAISEPVPIVEGPADPTPEKRSNMLVIGAVIGTVIMVALLYFWLFVWDDLARNNGDTGAPENAAVTEDVAAKQMFTVTEANIRDKATTIDSNIIGKLPRGSAITGVLKTGEDASSDWLELAEGKGFVAAINLTDTEPPVLVKAISDKIWTADGPVEIWSQPDNTSTLVDRVSEGTKLTLVGLTANDYVEIKLKKGGVGYLADGAAIIARANGKPIAISFNPQTCNFGGELEAEFAKIGARLRAQWAALEAKEFVDETAREKAYAAAEGGSTYVRLPRSFDGLSLTAIAQHYESQSLYFADPPTKVVEVFRAKGFKIGRDGAFPSTELYAGISATRGEGAAYGKSELGCGV